MSSGGFREVKPWSKVQALRNSYKARSIIQQQDREIRERKGWERYNQERERKSVSTEPLWLESGWLL